MKRTQALFTFFLWCALTISRGCGGLPVFAGEAHDLEQQILALQNQQKVATDQFEQGSKLQGQGALLQQAAQATFQTLAIAIGELQHKLDEAKNGSPQKDTARELPNPEIPAPLQPTP